MGRLAFVWLALVSMLCQAAEGVGEKTFPLHVDAQSLEAAIEQFNEQTGVEFVWKGELDLTRIAAKPLEGTYTATEALHTLLSDAPVSYQWTGPALVTIVQEPVGPQTVAAPTETPPLEQTVPQSLPEVLVKGARVSRNTDAERARNDLRPYSAFNRREIERSCATSPQEFLQSRLPSLDASTIFGGQSAVTGEADQIDLRGMGRDETLIIVDGRRIVGSTFGGPPLQTDIAGIPLEAVERIEVLGTTESARYGGSATAGTINIVLRRAEPGGRLSVTGEQLPGLGSGTQRAFGEYVGTFSQSRGMFSAWASYQIQPEVLTRDRDFITRGRSRIEANHPGFARSMFLPPVSAQTNIHTPNGSPIQACGDAASLFVPPGWQPADGLDALCATRNQYANSLAPTAQADGGALYTVRPRLEAQSADVTTQYDLTPWLSGDLEFGLSRIRRSGMVSGADYGDFRGVLVPANVAALFGQPVLVTIPVPAGDALMRNENVVGRAVAGLQAKLFGDWRARLEYSGSSSHRTQERPAWLGNADAIADGRVDVFRDPISGEDQAGTLGFGRLEGLRSTMRSATLLLAGSIRAWPAHNPTLTLALEQRREQLVTQPVGEWLSSPSVAPVLQRVIPPQAQRIHGGYAELDVPFIPGREQGAAALLEGRLNIRGDDYRADTARASDTSGLFDYSTSRYSAVSWMAGLRAEPRDWLSLRASCGTGFLPPSVSEQTLSVVQVANLPQLLDPRRGNEPVGWVRVLAGGNPELEPERSRSCTGGFALQFEKVLGLRFSVDMTRIHKTQEIYSPADSFFSDPTGFVVRVPARVTRGTLQPGDPYTVPPIAQVDVSGLNLLRSTVEAWDVAIDYTSRPLRIGTLHLSVLGTIQPVSASQLTEATPFENNANIGTLAPPHHQISASVELDRERLALGWSARYISPYEVSRDEVTILNQGDRYVSSQIYQDVWGRYTLPGRMPWGADLQVQVGARNILRRDPPFDAGAMNYASRHGIAEIPSFYVMFRAGFR